MRFCLQDGIQGTSLVDEGICIMRGSHYSSGLYLVDGKALLNTISISVALEPSGTKQSIRLISAA